MTADIEGISTNYVKEGQGENLLLLHGWGTNLSLFSAIIETAKKRYTVYAVDFPGFGGSDEPKEPWDVDGYVDFIIAFCKKMGIEKTVLLGHSFGGRVIIKLLSREDCPIEVEKVILTGSAGIKPPRSEKAEKKAKIYQRGKAFLSSKPIKALFPNALENYRNRHGSADYRAASPMMRQVLVKVVNEDLAPLLPLVKQETLLIWGENDDATPLSDGKQMEREMPDAALVTLPNAGHFAFLEQQYAFLRIISSFLKID